jgi:hypothetical protein
LPLEKLKESLNKDCFSQKYLIAIGKTERDSIKRTDSSIVSKKNLINSCDIVFTAAESCQIFNNARERLNSQ